MLTPRMAGDQLWMAQRAAKVTAIDNSENMLAYCRKNVAESGLENIDIRHLDWEKAVTGQDLEPHDMAIACRSLPYSWAGKPVF